MPLSATLRATDSPPLSPHDRPSQSRERIRAPLPSRRGTGVHSNPRISSMRGAFSLRGPVPEYRLLTPRHTKGNRPVTVSAGLRARPRADDAHSKGYGGPRSHVPRPQEAGRSFDSPWLNWATIVKTLISRSRCCRCSSAEAFCRASRLARGFGFTPNIKKMSAKFQTFKS